LGCFIWDEPFYGHLVQKLIIDPNISKSQIDLLLNTIIYIVLYIGQQTLFLPMNGVYPCWVVIFCTQIVHMGCTFMYNQLISTYFSVPIWTLYLNFIAKEHKLSRGHVIWGAKRYIFLEQSLNMWFLVFSNPKCFLPKRTLV